MYRLYIDNGGKKKYVSLFYGAGSSIEVYFTEDVKEAREFETRPWQLAGYTLELIPVLKWRIKATFSEHDYVSVGYLGVQGQTYSSWDSTYGPNTRFDTSSEALEFLKVWFKNAVKTERWSNFNFVKE